MTREEAIKVIKLATVYTPEEMKALETLIPELAESEDERIRKEMIEAISEIEPGKTYIRLSQKEKEAWISYLEKQKEQKSRIDACGFPLRDEGESACSYLERCLSPDMRNIWYEACSEIKEKQNEQKPISFNEPHNPDDYEVVIEGNGISLKRKEQKPWKVGANAYFTPEQKPAEWTKEDEERYISCLQRLGTGNPEQPETINSKWFKEHCHPQPKQEWSEEDIYITHVLEYIVGKHRPDEIFKIGNKQGVSAYKICSWLTSLRSQSKVEPTLLNENIIEAAIAFVEQNDHFNYWRGVDKNTVIKALHSLKPYWKPSEEQIEALKEASASWMNARMGNAKLLKSLYEQLKELM